jgi:hypothetical protein
MKQMKNDGQLNIRLPEEVLNSLLKIEESHGMTANEVLRRLAISAAQFYHEHGWFSFPATVTPTIFQNQEGAAATEADAPVGKSRVPSAAKAVNNQRHSPEREKGRFARNMDFCLGQGPAFTQVSPKGKQRLAQKK